MPLPVVAGIIVGAKAFGLGGVTYAGYQGAAYAYSSVRDWIDPSRVEKRNNEALSHLMKVKEDKETERMQNLDSVVAGIQQRKEALADKAIEQQAELQGAVKTIEQDSALIHEQTGQLVERFTAVNEASRTQEEVIAALQRELQEKMDAFEKSQAQLKESQAQFEKTSQELVEAKEEIAASNETLNQLREDLSSLCRDNKEKDLLIANLSQDTSSIQTQIETYRSSLTKATQRNTELIERVSVLSGQNQTYKRLVKTLTEQLETTTDNKQTSSVSPRFF